MVTSERVIGYDYIITTVTFKILMINELWNISPRLEIIDNEDYEDKYRIALDLKYSGIIPAEA